MQPTILLAFFLAVAVQLDARVVPNIDLDLDQSVESFLGSAFDDLPTRLEALTDCYIDELSGQAFGLLNFESPLSLRDLATTYYSIFPEKEISNESVQNLMRSVKEIVELCSSRPAGVNTQFGFTSLSDYSQAEFEALSGVIVPSTNISSHPELAGQGDGRTPWCHRGGGVPNDFDWRAHRAVTPVRNQGRCGGCWGFAITATVESAFLIHHKTNDINYDLSEQQLIDCVKRDGCHGGFGYPGFEFVKAHGQTDERSFPYHEEQNHCVGGKRAVAHINDWCVRSIYYYGNGLHPENFNEHEMQQALVHFGPLYVLFNAATLGTKHYRAGVFDDPGCPTKINHAVTIVGYTPNAWIIKNSWGHQWGEGGYLHLARGKNRCGINTEIAYPIVN